jgi:hypothetical protein
MQHKTTLTLLFAVLMISLSGCANTQQNTALTNSAESDDYSTKAIEIPSTEEYSSIKESTKQMNGAKTILLQYNIYTDDYCKVDPRQLHVLLDQLLDGYGKLKRVEATALPDLLATVNVEISGFPNGNPKPYGCMYFVNIRAVHPMLGKLRYGKEPVLIQALTFNKSAYNLIVPEKINDAIQIQSMRLLNMLIADHRAGTLNQ